MCLAEALLRIPDAETADRLIHDKLSGANWEKHLGHSRSLLVNASTWGLMLTGRLVRLEDETASNVSAFLERLAARSGSGLVRLALKQAMGILAGQFVMGRTIEEALQRSLRDELRFLPLFLRHAGRGRAVPRRRTALFRGLCPRPARDRRGIPRRRRRHKRPASR